jgi:hypothetical protein
MQAIRDSLIVLALLLVVVTIRVTPLEDVVDLVPETQAATAEQPAPAKRAQPAKQPSSCSAKPDEAPCTEVVPLTPSPMGTPRLLELDGPDGSRVMVLIEVERDGRLEAGIENCPTDPDRPLEAPAAGSA